MDMVTVPKRIVDLLTQIQKYGTIARASELQEVYRLIAAHNAGAQEPVIHAAFETEDSGITGWQSVPVKRIAQNDDGSFTAIINYWPQTDAARDVLVRAKRMLEGYADSYKRMGQDSTSRGGDGRITCTAIMYDIRNNMAGWCDAEIERLDRETGE